MHLFRKIYCLGFFFILFTTPLAALPQTKINQAQHFLSLADLHFDPFLSCQKSPCQLIQALQEAPVAQWKEIFLHSTPSNFSYGKDSNYYLFESALNAAQKEAKNQKIQFILVLGDFLAHDYNQKFFRYSSSRTATAYIHFVKKTLTFLATEFNHYFPETNIYWLVGNNDSYQKDYSVDPNGLFFKDFCTIQASLLKTKIN